VNKVIYQSVRASVRQSIF